MKGVADTSESDGMEWMEEHFRVRPQLPEDVVSLARNLKLDCAEALSKEDPRGKMPMACFPLLFWDFLSLSLPQQCREEGAGKEKEGTEASTQAEHILKRFALEKGWVSFVYRNLSENVYFLRDTLVPSGDTRVTIKTPYHLRGWATFEKCLVAGKDRERIYQVRRQSEGADRVRTNPMSPNDFREHLERVDEGGKLIIYFPGGYEDRKMVGDMYEACMRASNESKEE